MTKLVQMGPDANEPFNVQHFGLRARLRDGFEIELKDTSPNGEMVSPRLVFFGNKSDEPAHSITFEEGFDLGDVLKHRHFDLYSFLPRHTLFAEVGSLLERALACALSESVTVDIEWGGKDDNDNVQVYLIFETEQITTWVPKEILEKLFVYEEAEQS